MKNNISEASVVCITDPSDNLVEATDSLPRTMHLISAVLNLGADDPEGAVWWPSEPCAACGAGAGGPAAYLPLTLSHQRVPSRAGTQAPGDLLWSFSLQGLGYSGFWPPQSLLIIPLLPWFY